MLSVLNVEKSLPAWYDLRFMAPGRLVVEVEPSVMGRITELLHTECPYTRGLHEESMRLVIPEFIRPDQDAAGWGFGKQLKPCKAEVFPNWSAYEVELPVLQSKGLWYWQAGYAASATLSVLFYLLKGEQESVPQHKAEQLVCIEGMLADSTMVMHGGSIALGLAEHVKIWLNKFGQDHSLREVVDAMKAAYAHMYPDKESLRHVQSDFRASVWYDHSVRIVVPGNCCCLADADRQRRYGSYLSSHNCDDPLQQLTFLAGIATLNQLVRGQA
jgi:hypothetical protein